MGRNELIFSLQISWSRIHTNFDRPLTNLSQAHTLYEPGRGWPLTQISEPTQPNISLNISFSDMYQIGIRADKCVWTLQITPISEPILPRILLSISSSDMYQDLANNANFRTYSTQHKLKCQFQWDVSNWQDGRCARSSVPPTRKLEISEEIQIWQILMGKSKRAPIEADYS